MSPSQWLLLIFLALLWGGSFFFTGIAIRELPPLVLVLGRVGGAALVLLVVLAVMGLALPRTLAGWWPFLVMALLNVVVPFLLIARGQKEIASGLASVLNATTPLWSVLLAHAFFDDERLKANKLAGVAVGIAGVAILVGPEVLLGSGTTLLGMACGLGGALAYGFSGIWGRRFKATPPLVTACAQLVAATAMLAPLAVLFDPPWLLAMPSGRVVAAMVGLAVLSTALGYIVFFRIMAVSGPTNAMLVTLLNPVSAISLGTLILGERLEPRQIAGALVIGAALLLIDGRVLGLLKRGARPMSG